MKKLLSWLLMLALLLGGFALAEEDAAEKDLIILYTSDVHCGIDEGWGYAGLYDMKRALAADGYDVLLVDDGDHYQGEASGTMTTGEAILEIMNTVGYDVVIPGNHDFDYGVDRFLELAGRAEFPYICCNFFKDGKQVFPSWLIKEVGKKRIGFVGVLTPQTLITSTPTLFQNEQGEYFCDFLADGTGEKLYAAVQKAVDDVTAEGVDYVILLAHLGEGDDFRPYSYADVIANTTGITAVLDGHSHDTDQVVMKNRDGQDVIRTACGTKMAYVGALTITGSGKVSSALYLWSVDGFSAPELLGLKNTAEKAVEKVNESLREVISQVIGETPVTLTIYDPTAKDDNGAPIRIVRRAETNLADLVADAYLDQSGGADIVLLNGGAIRASIQAGEITMGDLLAVQPFNNSLALVEVTGQQVLDALEWGARSLPQELGGFLQVAGLTYEVDPSVPTPCVGDSDSMFVRVEENAERRVRNVQVGGEALDPEKNYRLSGINYMILKHGDGYTMFDGCTVVMKDIILDNQALINYFKKLTVDDLNEKYGNPYGDGRIVIEAASE